MKAKVKALGLALIAAMAIGALGAQGASAEDFESAAETTVLTAEGSNHQLSVTGFPLNCSVVSLIAHVPSSTTTEVTVVPTYTQCVGFGFFAKVTGFGHFGESDTCDYVLHANGTADLECEEEAAVVIDAGTCSVTIPEQTGLGSVSYKNVANGDVEVDLDISEITLDHKDGFACPFDGSGTDTKIGLLTGSSLVSGEDADGNPVDIFWNGTD